MRYDKIQEEHVARKRVHHKTVCDGCGLDIKAVGYDASEVTIDAKIGKYYPEGDQRTMYEVDVCPACFVGKVVPALAAAGIVVRARDADDYEESSVLTPPEPPRPEPTDEQRYAMGIVGRLVLNPIPYW